MTTSLLTITIMTSPEISRANYWPYMEQYDKLVEETGQELPLDLKADFTEVCTIERRRMIAAQNFFEEDERLAYLEQWPECIKRSANSAFRLQAIPHSVKRKNWENLWLDVERRIRCNCLARSIDEHEVRINLRWMDAKGKFIEDLEAIRQVWRRLPLFGPKFGELLQLVETRVEGRIHEQLLHDEIRTREIIAAWMRDRSTSPGDVRVLENAEESLVPAYGELRGLLRTAQEKIKERLNDPFVAMREGEKSLFKHRLEWAARYTNRFVAILNDEVVLDASSKDELVDSIFKAQKQHGRFRAYIHYFGSSRS
jgi:hypothetical protein